MSEKTQRTRAITLTAAGLAAAFAFVAISSDANAGKRQQRKIAKNLSLITTTPLGLQGTAGAGERSVLPFRLEDRSRRRVEVQVEYGIDLDGDGEIADGTQAGKPSEYRTATHRRRDPRDTSRVKRRANGSSAVTYRPSRGGASHAFAWDNLSDIGRTRVVHGAQMVRDATGRVQFDPFDRSQPLFTEAQPGVVLRARAVRRGGKRQRTDWVYTQPFSVDNSLAPSAELTRIAGVDSEAGLATIEWRAFDNDSEDANGNGVLDVLDLEDRNGNGALDVAPVAVAFDYHRLNDGEPIPTRPSVLAALDWQPCTHAEGLGDPDVGLPTAPEGVGRDATFVWDFRVDLGAPQFAAGTYIVRATPFDDVGNLGAAAYLLDPIVLEAAQD